MNENILTCVIVDDEPIARYGVRGYVDKIEWLECAGMFEDVAGLESFLSSAPNVVGGGPDIIFLDIDMPHCSGLDFLAAKAVSSSVVIITAYSQYALRGYELDVVDYLLKPVSFSRFLRAVEKVRHHHNAMSSGPGYVMLKADSVVYRVMFSDIIYVEAMENYIKVYTVVNNIVTRMPMHRLLALLPDDIFMQVHKSFIVNLQKICKIDGSEIYLDKGFVVPVSRKLKGALLERL